MGQAVKRPCRRCGHVQLWRPATGPVVVVSEVTCGLCGAYGAPAASSRERQAA